MGKQNLYAFLVAINDYESKPLSGCLNDLSRMEQYLRDRYKGEYNLQIEKLEDKKATRANVINGFQHFEAAKDGDVCLFFFAGHGSSIVAPAELQHLESDGKLETLVCYDSRLEGGRDLLDKELRYLIWKATKDKNVHFLTIMDCCYSGGNTRKLDDIIGIRRHEDSKQKVLVDQILGSEAFERDENGLFQPKIGRAIALSAARPDQTAKEVYADRKPTGAFSYFLVQTLQENGGNLDYQTLISKVNVNVQRTVKEQSPQLESTQVEDEKLRFLSNQKWDGIATYILFYDRNSREWKINAGAVHGIVLGNKNQYCEFQLLNQDRSIKPTQATAAYCIVEGINDLDIYKTYNIQLKQNGSESIKVGFADDLPASAIQELKATYQQETGLLKFQFVDSAENIRYLVRYRADQNVIELTIPNDRIPLFEEIPLNALDQYPLFVERINAVCNWRNTLDLTNLRTEIAEREIEISFFKLTEAANYAEHAPKVKTAWNTTVALPYLKEGEQQYNPAFQMRIKNTGKRRLWVSTLYLQRDFGITNQLLPTKYIDPNEEVWLNIVRGGLESKTIKLKIEAEFLAMGLTKITEYLKVFVATEEFRTDQLQQGKLPQSRGASKDRGIDDDPVKGDWRSFEIPLELRIEK